MGIITKEDAEIIGVRPIFEGVWVTSQTSNHFKEGNILNWFSQVKGNYNSLISWMNDDEKIGYWNSGYSLEKNYAIENISRYLEKVQRVEHVLSQLNKE